MASDLIPIATRETAAIRRTGIAVCSLARGAARKPWSDFTFEQECAGQAQRSGYTPRISG